MSPPCSIAASYKEVRLLVIVHLYSQSIVHALSIYPSYRRSYELSICLHRYPPDIYKH